MRERGAADGVREILGPTSDERFDPVVTLQIESGSLRDVIEALIRETGFAFIISSHVKDRDGISIDVDEAPASQVFAALRDTYGICAWRHPRVTPHNVVRLEVCGVPKLGNGQEPFPSLESIP
jgi:hypothetical protein